MIRVGVIGAGAWGLNHIRTLSAMSGCELSCIADPDASARERARALAPHALAVDDAGQLLERDDVDAVVIASPAPTHTQLAIRAFGAGKHVLVEKPLAMSLSDAMAVRDAARTSQRIGMVGHLMLFHPAVVRLRQLLSSGALGSLHYLHSTRVNLGRIRRDENALWSFGPHDLSMIDFLVDRSPASVSARGLSVLQPGVEDVVFLTLRYATGEMAHVHLSWLSPRKERRLTLICSQKMAEFDDVSGDKLKIYDKGYDRPPEFTEYAQYLTLRDGDVHIPQLVMQEPLRVELQHFLACIENGTQPLTNMDTGVRVTQMLEAGSRSMAADGAPVDLST